MEDFEEANIIIPRKIAKICARLKNDPVKRLIHFSANGVDPDSHSKMLKTKWLGEMEVKEHFPEATIIRPTEILHSKPIRNFIG
jgi:dTDP-4-dehydrorhamnose reductase